MTRLMPETGEKKDKSEAVPRQFVSFRFYSLQPAFRFLPEKEKEESRQEFQEAIESFKEKVLTYSYSLLGMRADCDMMLWKITFDLENFELMEARLLKTKLARYLQPRYSFLSQTRRSIYVDKLEPHHQEERLRIVPGSGKYLFVYPFVKKRAWYRLPFEERQKMMDEHILIGSKYKSVKLHTTYSFGLDDQEFVVAFETDSPSDFLDLVMELRGSEASAYTEKDTPIFTCMAQPLSELLQKLG